MNQEVVVARILTPYCDLFMNFKDEDENSYQIPCRLFTMTDMKSSLLCVPFIIQDKDITIEELAGAPNLRYTKFVTLDNVNNGKIYNFDDEIYRHIPANGDELIYVVHWKFFLNYTVQEIKGKNDIFAFQGSSNDDLENISLYKPFPLFDVFIFGNRNTLLNYDNNINHYFYNMAHGLYNLSRNLIRNIRQCLIDSKGIGKIKFIIRCTYKEMIYLEQYSVAFSTTNSFGRTFIQHHSDGIIRSAIPSLLVCFVVMRIDVLFKFLGEDFFYYPICEHNFLSGNLRNHMYASIPIMNAKLTFLYDINTHDLIVTADVIQDFLGNILITLDQSLDRCWMYY
jgi:hypothetical protein